MLRSARSFISAIGFAVVAVPLVCGFSGAAHGQGKRIGSYIWSTNQSFDPPSDLRLQVQTALTTDSDGRVWLAYLDAEYRRAPATSFGSITMPEQWHAWPRRVILRSSEDQGRTFGPPRVLSKTGSDQALAADTKGNLYGAWAQTDPPPSLPIGRPRAILGERRIVLQQLRVGNDVAPAFQPISWNEQRDLAEAHISLDQAGDIHVVGIDTGFASDQPRPPRKIKLLYARATTGGETIFEHELESLDHFPQVAVSGNLVIVVGPNGFVRSLDGGKTFSKPTPREFGQRLARIALSPDGKSIYVVGDIPVGLASYAPKRGLKLHRSRDAGESWETFRIDDADRATAWRFPAIHVEKSGRAHIIWMDDRAGSGAVHHAYSDDDGRTFSPNEVISDQSFVFPGDASYVHVALNKGTWIGAYISITSVSGTLIAAWSDQRAGLRKSVVYYATAAQSAR